MSRKVGDAWKTEEAHSPGGEPSTSSCPSSHSQISIDTVKWCLQVLAKRYFKTPIPPIAET